MAGVEHPGRLSSPITLRVSLLYSLSYSEAAIQSVSYNYCGGGRNVTVGT